MIQNNNKYGEGKLHGGFARSTQLSDENPTAITEKLENLASRLLKLTFGHDSKKRV